MRFCELINRVDLGWKIKIVALAIDHVEAISFSSPTRSIRSSFVMKTKSCGNSSDSTTNPAESI